MTKHLISTQQERGAVSEILESRDVIDGDEILLTLTWFWGACRGEPL